MRPALIMLITLSYYNGHWAGCVCRSAAINYLLCILSLGRFQLNNNAWRWKRTLIWCLSYRSFLYATVPSSRSNLPLFSPTSKPGRRLCVIVSFVNDVQPGQGEITEVCFPGPQLLINKYAKVLGRPQLSLIFPCLQEKSWLIDLRRSGLLRVLARAQLETFRANGIWKD